MPFKKLLLTYAALEYSTQLKKGLRLGKKEGKAEF
jgi:hypothetical protein